jgi:hypothetical protein
MLAGLAWKGKEQAPRTWLEDGRDANGRAYALGQQDLVVLRAEGTHHQAKDVQQAAGEEQLSRAVFVIYDAHGRALCCVSCFAALRVEKGATACSYHGAHEEYLQRGNPCNGAGRVRRQQRVLVVFLEGTNTYFELKITARRRKPKKPDVLFIQPKLQNETHHAPRTTNQAVVPPSATTGSLGGC